MSSLCCACETYIVLKLKNSSDVPINLVQGRELSEAGELVEMALDVTLNPNTPFPLFVRTVTNLYQTLNRNTRKTRKNLEKLEIRLKPNTFGQSPKDAVKRMSIEQSSETTCTDRARKKPKKIWTYLPDINPSLSSLEKLLREEQST